MHPQLVPKESNLFRVVDQPIGSLFIHTNSEAVVSDVILCKTKTLTDHGYEFLIFRTTFLRKKNVLFSLIFTLNVALRSASIWTKIS